jgi:hypothetical protein
MSLEHTRAYKAAYLTYLRTGLPIELSLKHARQTPQYVWETRRFQGAPLASPQ